MTRLLLGSAAIFAFAPALSATAQPTLPDDDKATWGLVVENDLFGGSDRNYTNGLRLSYLSGAKESGGAEGWLANVMSGGAEDLQVRRGIAVGHSIYTPRDTGVATPLPDQHPYAGFLYGEYTIVAQQPSRLDRLSITLGIVGPSALGEEVQNGFHDLIDDESVQGWDNQIDDEAIINIGYDRRFKAIATGEFLGVGLDVTPNVGFNAGNFRTDANAGLTFRIGSNLYDYGPPRIRPSLAGAGYFVEEPGLNWYVFAGAEGRAVAHAIVLDGSFFRDDDPQVPSNTFVGDLQAGFAIQLAKWQFTYTHVYRTEQFEGQDEPQMFGALSLARKF